MTLIKGTVYKTRARYKSPWLFERSDLDSLDEILTKEYERLSIINENNKQSKIEAEVDEYKKTLDANYSEEQKQDRVAKYKASVIKRLEDFRLFPNSKTITL